MTKTTRSTHPAAWGRWTNRRRAGVIGGALVTLGLSAGCVPATPSDESLASTIVLTKRAPAVNFTSYRTFFLRPEIRELKDDDMNATLDPATAAPLLAETRKQMISRGYQETATQSEAQIGLEMLFVNSTWVATSCYSWWDYGYWGYPPYYPYYPYWGACSASTWQTNNLTTMMVDLNPALLPTTGDAGGGIADSGVDAPFGPPRVIGGIWFSAVYGIHFNAADALQKGVDGIDQAFAQSPYLTTAN